jgi:lauroyl/myristoyl acyltransferase
LNASDPIAGATAAATEPARDARVPRRFTLHGLNNGLIFSATCRGVAFLPPSVSHAIGHVGTWIAWRTMAGTRAAVADNLSALFPDRTPAERERLALATLRSYARDVVDFLRALRAPQDEIDALFEYKPEYVQLFDGLMARGQGVILVTGHYGNWELGAVAMQRVFKMPLTIVAMTEASETVNDLRREIRESLGADTIEVRKSLDTALQIRKRLGENRMVAMLMDRHIGRDRVEVTFLGRRTWFLKAPAMMAYMSQAPLVPCFIERVGPRRFSVSPGEPIFVTRERPREEAMQIAAQAFAAQLEARIRRQPHYWYHFYRYWDAQRDDYGELA